ncbi:hypothetical protein K0B03_04575 [Patescibacteria group bacterium]|nr:hypothetical protein [Patescibacteria group bacterium]
MIIGVYTPTSKYGIDKKSITEIVTNLDIDWPVISDKEYKFYRKFQNELWSALCLFDQEKNLVYGCSGKFKYIELKENIKNLLKKIT